MFISMLVIVAIFGIISINGQSLPSLPLRFTAIVEANILNKNMSYIMEEWYDFNASMAKRIFYYSNFIDTTFEDFSNDKDELWHYVTFHDDISNPISCTLESYSNNRNIFNNDQSSSGGLASSAEWFQFGKEFNEHYVGKTVIRGINVEGWRRNGSFNFNYSDGSTIIQQFDLTYYFSLANWNWFYSPERQIPIRVILDGTRTTDYNNGSTEIISDYLHYYDYVQFLEDDLTLGDELEFDIPDFYEQCNVTSYCDYYNDTKPKCTETKGPALPTLPYSWSGTVELSITGEFVGFGTFDQVTIIASMDFDYENNRIHAVWRGMDGYYKNAYHSLDIGNKSQLWSWFGDGAEYTPTTTDDNIYYCSMRKPESNFTGWDDFALLENGHVANPYHYFAFDDHHDHVNHGMSEEIWMGYTTVRGIRAEKWKASLHSVVNGGESGEWTFGYILPENQRLVMNWTINYYFSAENVTFAYMTNESIIPLRVDFIGTNYYYNLSNTGDWELVQTMSLNEVGHFISFLPMTPDPAYFKKPIYWRRDCTIDPAYCSDDTFINEDVCDTGIELPTLPEHKYYTLFEGNDLINKKTSVYRQWYNYDTNEYRLEAEISNLKYIMYDSIETDKRWTWLHEINDTDNIIMCKLEPYASTARVDDFTEVSNGHVKRVTDLWHFGDKYNETYLGNDFTVRGINARAWHSLSNSSYQLNDTYSVQFSSDTTLYFADSDWDYYDSIETADVPVRMAFTGHFDNPIPDGSGNMVTDFDMSYEIVNFLSGPEAFDEDEMQFVFENWYSKCDVTTYCDEYPNDDVCTETRGPKMPHLPYEFFAMIEGTINVYDDDDNNVFNGTYVFEEWYDYDGNEAHIVIHTGPNWRGNAMHQLDLLNKEQKWLWFGHGYDHDDHDHDDGDDHDDDGDEITGCILTLTQSNFTGVDMFITETNGHIASPSKWFRWNDSDVTTKDIWSGYTTVRGIPAQKWVTNWNEYNEVEANAYQDAYAYQLDAIATYYYSLEDNNIAASNWDTVPLRATLEGTYTLWNYSEIDQEYNIFWTTSKTNANYEVTVFNANGFDEDYFEIPTYWRQNCLISDEYCNKYPQSEQCYPGPSLPDWPDAFSTTVMAGFTDKNYTMTVREYFDYNGNRELVVIEPYMANTPWGVIGDEGIQNNYLMNNRAFWFWNEEECILERVEQLANSSITPINGFFFQTGQKEHVSLSADMFHWVKNTSTQHYMGKEYVRGIYSDRWDNIVEGNYTQADIHTEYEGTITYYFISDETNTKYPDYNIPVRARVAGYIHIWNSTGDSVYDSHFDHYYEFINFKPGVPDPIYFTPPSNTTCNFTLWCNDIDNIPDDEYDDYEYLIELCDSIDDDGLVETECYSSCGELYKTDNDCITGNQALLPIYVWIILLILLFIIGIVIGAYVTRIRAKKAAVNFQQFKDTQDDHNL